MIKRSSKLTIPACFIGYIVQGIVNNFLPLLFVTFGNTYGISLAQVTSLIVINFAIQLIVDLLSAGFIDKIGYRASIMIAHIFASVGFILLAFLPDVLSNHFLGILIPVVLYAVGGGLLEVLISPIMDACPTENKGRAMSMLHSFYSWGYMGVVLISSLFFTAFGIEKWRILALIWAIVPTVNVFLFARSEIYTPCDNGECGMTIGELLSQKIFWVFMLMMLCAGASEQALCQWASTFAEQGLGLSKSVADLAGPVSFAFAMGISRLIFGKCGHKIKLEKFTQVSCVLCIISYLCVSLIDVPIIGFMGCALCGFSVGIMWPGTYGEASAVISRGGTAMFALLAFAGDLGCSAGPALAGAVSSGCGDNLRAGILASVIFPILLLVGSFILGKKKTEN